MVGATANCSNYDRTRLGWREKEVSKLFLGRTKFSDGFGDVTKHIDGVLQNQTIQAKHYLVDVDIGESDIVFYVMNSNPFWEMNQRMEDEIENYLGHCDNDNNDDVASEILEEPVLVLPTKTVKNMPTSRIFEKMPSQGKDMIQKGESALSICRFLHVCKVIVKVCHRSILMFCNCCMDNRCGTICRHKFAVFSKYLQPIGFNKFDHDSVHCINWNSYHY